MCVCVCVCVFIQQLTMLLKADCISKLIFNMRLGNNYLKTLYGGLCLRLIIPVLSQQLSVSHIDSFFNYIGTVSVFISLHRSGCVRLHIQ